MLKFKSIAPLVLSNLRNGRLQLYSKAASQAEPALSMPDALGAKVEEEPVKAASNPVPVETSVEQNEKPIATVETSEKTDVATSSAAPVKKPKGCKQAGAGKGKKGKKCGQPKPPPPPRPPGPPPYLEDKCDMYDIPKHNTTKWRKISYALIPFALGLSAFVFATRKEPPEQDYIPYEYMYIRTKRFPWRDGKTSLFHGPNNIIPEEEEERIDREAEEAPPPDKKDAPADKKGAPDGKKGEAGGKEPRYKKSVDEHEEKVKLRDQHAKEELERRKKRHEQEKAKKEAKEAEKAKKNPSTEQKEAEGKA